MITAKNIIEKVLPKLPDFKFSARERALLGSHHVKLVEDQIKHAILQAMSDTLWEAGNVVHRDHTEAADPSGGFAIGVALRQCAVRLLRDENHRNRTDRKGHAL